MIIHAEYMFKKYKIFFKYVIIINCYCTCLVHGNVKNKLLFSYFTFFFNRQLNEFHEIVCIDITIALFHSVSCLIFLFSWRLGDLL
jgi:hypothetical protein